MEVYKVVIHDSNCSTSFPYVVELCLHYKIGERITPKIGKIFVFKTKWHAEKFVKKYGLIMCSFIFEGEAEKCTSISKICNFMSTDDYRSFWKAKKNHKDPEDFCVTQEPPEGTLVCSAFTPEKIVPFSWEHKG